MIHALVSGVLGQLPSIVGEVSDELKLLKGVETEIQNLKTNFEAIEDVLDDAEKRSLKEETGVQMWVDQLKDICYDMEDVLDEWRTDAVLQQQQQQQRQPVHCASWLVEKVMPCISSLIPWIRRPVWMHNIALKIKDINQRLDDVVKGKDRFNFTTGTTTANEPESPQTKTTSFGDDVSELDVRKDVTKSLTDGLLSGESSQEEEEHHKVSITAIVGMGGIGKTTLARQAFNDESVKKHFDKPSEERRVWVCVSRPFDATNVARAILEGLNCGTSGPTQLENMLRKISAAIKEEKFLLVLDDVWNDDEKKWEPLRSCLKNGAQGSKILMTTRSEDVAKMMKPTNLIPLKSLSDEECWSIFSHHAFFGKSKDECEHLKDIGWKIMERCKGLPLAAKVLGGLMPYKKSSAVGWQEVLDSDLWELEEANNDIYPVFMLSYYDLPSPMKRCFTYCALFPEDHVFKRDRLIQLWMANGFLKGGQMESTGEKYVESFATRSLFQDLERDPISDRIEECRMHDLVREFALRLSKNECGEIEFKGDAAELTQQELSDYAKLRHVRLTCKSGGEHSSASSALSKFSITGLRTLLSRDLEGPNVEEKVLGGLFCGLTSLRTLELRASDIKELPAEIGKLMHLRYLGLEKNRDLVALPEAVCDLFNLETLKLNHCDKIKKLPRGIGKLLNLRHLQLFSTGIRKLPKGIGELTFLRTLWGNFLISRDDNDKEEECFGIGDFEKLNCLENLSPYGLGNAKLLDDVAAGEAKRARLNNKKSLRTLALHFEVEGPLSNEGFEEAQKAVQLAKNDLLVAEALLEEPPPHVEELAFVSYRGTKLPNKVTCLSGLKVLYLHECPNLKELPGGFFERLPLVRKVYITDSSTSLAGYCRRRMRENRALASVFKFED